MKSRTLSLSLRVALYRRAVACAWLSAWVMLPTY